MTPIVGTARAMRERPRGVFLYSLYTTTTTTTTKEKEQKNGISE